MNKESLANFAKSVQFTLSKHSPEILTGVGIAGMITTTVLAVRATPKALKLIEEAKKEERKDKLTVVETVKVAWKPYIPVVVTGAASVACLVGASSVNLRRNAALATAYKLSETALTEYREKVVETIGEKKEKVVRDAVDKERIEKDPVTRHTVISTGQGKSLCYDYMSGRYFESSREIIERAENEFNKQIIHDLYGYASLNEFYDLIDLDHIGTGDDLGWNIHNLVDINFGSQLTDDGRPCIVISHNNPPNYKFDKVL